MKSKGSCHKFVQGSTVPGSPDTLGPARHRAGRQSYERLQKEGVQVRFETYAGMGHSACPQELEEVKKFLAQRLA